MKPMGGAVQPTSDLDLRFRMCWAHLLIRACVFLGFWARGRSRSTPVQRNRPEGSLEPPHPYGLLWRFGPGAVTFKEGHRYLYA